MVFFMMIRAVVLKDILWPQKQEDREEGGWKTNPTEIQACDLKKCDTNASSTTGRGIVKPNDARPDGQALQQEYTGTGGGDIDPSNSQMPSIPEGVMEQSIRGSAEKANDDMV